MFRLAPRQGSCCLLIFLASLLSGGHSPVSAQTYDTLRLTSYNVLNYPGSTAPTRNPRFRAVLNYVSPDILVVQEMTSSSGHNQFRDSILNYSQPGQYVAVPFNDGPDSDNGLFYRPSKVTFLFANYIATELRNIAEYVLKSATAPDTFRVYSLHLKASSGSTNEQQRWREAKVLSTHLNALPAGTKFIVLGDFNIYRSTEPAFQRLVSPDSNGTGKCTDPFNLVGNWQDNAAFAPHHTQSPRTVALGDGGATGGLDDRFDMMLLSDGIQPHFLTSTFKIPGNDGNHLNQQITVLPNNSVPDTSILNGLYYASDHLPIYANLIFPNTQTPLVTTVAASGITISGATLNGNVNPRGSSTNAYFQWGTNLTLANSTAQQPMGAGSSGLPVSAGLSGLSSNTKYYFRVAAVNAGGTAFGSIDSFQTPMAPPAIPVLDDPVDGANSVPTVITLNWLPAANAQTYRIQLASDSAFASILVEDSTVTTTFKQVGPLSPVTPYFWRVRASNQVAQSNFSGAWMFTTEVVAPLATTGNATNITISDATLNGTADPRSSSSSSYFEWGPSPVLGFSTASQNIGSGSGAVPVSASITGLASFTKYYFRIRATNAGGTTFGSIDSFQTLLAAPSSPSLASPSDGATGLPASVTFTWHAQQQTETFSLQLSTDSVFSSLVISDSSLVDTFRTVSGLIPSTTYFWRVRAKNAAGESAFSSTRRVTTSSFVVLQHQVNGGWNLVSLPVSVADTRVTSVYPASTSPAFRFAPSSGYQQRDSLKNGIGYWLKFGAQQMVSITGGFRNSDTITVSTGWNLIGTVSTAIDTSSVTTIPSGIRASDFFGYSGSYTSSATLQPGRAYWVKMNSAGTIILQAPALPGPK